MTPDATSSDAATTAAATATPLYRRWWPWSIFLAALALRLHWTLVVHPLDGFLYSDMSGYNNRANGLLSAPWKIREYRAFYPFGTTWFLASVKLIFGRDNFAAIGIVQSLLGAASTVWCYFLALRISRHPTVVAPAVGTLMIIYYPVMSLTGYTLSETPAIFLLTLGALLTAKAVQERRRRVIVGLGLTLAAAVTVRPQLLLGFGLLLLIALWRRGPLQLPRRVWLAFIPVAAVLVFSSARLYRHTGRLGTVSENSAVNLVFGRCHNKGIYSRPDGKGHGTVRFGPPPFIQLERHSTRHPDSWMTLDPAFGDLPRGDIPTIDGVEGFDVDAHGCRKKGSCRLRGAELEYHGYIGDQALQRKIASACIERTGWLRQLRYSMTHIVQLWAYNQMWPEQANPKPRAKDPHWRWGRMTASWKRFHNNVLLIPALLGLVLAWRRGHAALWFAAAHVYALLAVAFVILGGIRFRVVYDPLLLFLALEVYASVILGLVRRLRLRAPTS